MQENVGRIDRVVRAIVGPGLAAVGIAQLRRGNMVTGVLAIVAGALAVNTAVTRVCPLNAALGIDMRSRDLRLSDSRTALRTQTEQIAPYMVEPEVANDAIRLA